MPDPKVPSEPDDTPVSDFAAELADQIAGCALREGVVADTAAMLRLWKIAADLIDSCQDQAL